MTTVHSLAAAAPGCVLPVGAGRPTAPAPQCAASGGQAFTDASTGWAREHGRL